MTEQTTTPRVLTPSDDTEPKRLPVQPWNEYLLCRRVEPLDSAGELLLPEGARRTAQANFFEVVAKGQGRQDLATGEWIDTMAHIEVGHRIFLIIRPGFFPFEFSYDGEDYAMIHSVAAAGLVPDDLEFPLLVQPAPSEPM